jgi:TonB family protein
MTRFFAAIITLLFGFYAYSQSSDSSLVDTGTVVQEQEVFEFFSVSEKAEFPGGDEAFSRYIAKNLEYPADAIKDDVEGSVFIQFDIDTAGNVVNEKIMNVRLTGTDTVGYDYCLGECALKVVKDSPKWTPAKARDKKVSMRYRIPIRFRLQ